MEAPLHAGRVDHEEALWIVFLPPVDPFHRSGEYHRDTPRVACLMQVDVAEHSEVDVLGYHGRGELEVSHLRVRILCVADLSALDVVVGQKDPRIALGPRARSQELGEYLPTHLSPLLV